MLSAIKLSDFLSGSICFENCFRDTAEACSDAAGSSIQLYCLELSQQSLRTEGKVLEFAPSLYGDGVQIPPLQS